MNEFNQEAIETFSFNVVKSISNFSDTNCEAVNGKGCFYKGNQTGNYVSFANKIWRIYQKENNRLHLILNDNYTTSNYSFSSVTTTGYCSNDWCCNGGYGGRYSGQSNPYLVTSITTQLDSLYSGFSTANKNLVQNY